MYRHNTGSDAQPMTVTTRSMAINSGSRRTSPPATQESILDAMHEPVPPDCSSPDRTDPADEQRAGPGMTPMCVRCATQRATHECLMCHRPCLCRNCRLYICDKCAGASTTIPVEAADSPQTAQLTSIAQRDAATPHTTIVDPEAADEEENKYKPHSQ